MTRHAPNLTGAQNAATKRTIIEMTRAAATDLRLPMEASQDGKPGRVILAYRNSPALHPQLAPARPVVKLPRQSSSGAAAGVAVATGGVWSGVPACVSGCHSGSSTLPHHGSIPCG